MDNLRMSRASMRSIPQSATPEESSRNNTPMNLMTPANDEETGAPMRAPSQCSSARLSRKPLNRLHLVQQQQGEDQSRCSSYVTGSEDSSQKVLITEFSEDDSNQSPHLGGGGFKASDSIGDMGSDDRDSDTDTDLDSCIEADIDDAEQYDTDLEIDGDEFVRGSYEYDATGMKTYIKECNTNGVIPVTYFLKHVHDRQFIMKFHGLGGLGAKAIAKPLEQNTTIERLDLEGNHVESEGAVYLGRMLRDNLFITELNLSENNIGSDGCAVICDSLMENTTLSELDLSGNGFRDADAEHFHKLLNGNMSMRKLFLRHNHFETEAGRWFRDALTNNENLKMLDLSWNHFRLKGAGYLAEMIKENYGLKYLNLAMNGLGLEGAMAIGDAMKHNQCLLELNLSDNRIPDEGAERVAQGLSANDVLETLRMGRNPVSHVSALQMLISIQRNLSSSNFFRLDLNGIIVCKKFDELVEKIKEDNRTLEIIHGGILFQSKHIITPVTEDLAAAFDNDPMTKLKKFATKKMLRLVDLFRQFDKDNSWSVSHEEFTMGVKSTGIDMTQDEIDILIERLDKDGDGEIDYEELAVGDKDHRQKKREVTVWKKEMDSRGIDPSVEREEVELRV